VRPKFLAPAHPELVEGLGGNFFILNIITILALFEILSNLVKIDKLNLSDMLYISNKNTKNKRPDNSSIETKNDNN